MTRKPIDEIIEHMRSTNPISKDWKGGHFIWECCVEIYSTHLERELDYYDEAVNDKQTEKV